jgi:hypothetical protein
VSRIGADDHDDSHDCLTDHDGTTHHGAAHDDRAAGDHDRPVTHHDRSATHHIDDGHDRYRGEHDDRRFRGGDRPFHVHVGRRVGSLRYAGGSFSDPT